jgi:hypothetical protein
VGLFIEETVTQGSRKQQILTEEIKLLYGNANVGVGVTVIAASVLAYLQWQVVPQPVVLGWWTYMAVVAVGFILALRWYATTSSISSCTQQNRPEGTARVGSAT